MLQPATVNFLKNLTQNNHRDWFNSNKTAYETAKRDFENFVDSLIMRISVFDPPIANLKAKDCVFRIYRDVRFSKSKEPYKTNFGAYLTSGGKKSPKPGYYLHVQPNRESFIAGGAYQPSSSTLNAIRQEIDYNLTEFNGIINSNQFKKYFDGIDGETAKTNPKGYGKDHPAIELLRHKDFLVMHSLPDELLINKNAGGHIAKVCKAMKPFNDFLARSYD